ncbi:MAG: cyclic nucleotide-binding domain-containing protein [Nitrospirae bacterium]|nr:cyclic nucleotide-binding domain-containing protein [Nitrospirota bacterium]
MNRGADPATTHQTTREPRRLALTLPLDEAWTTALTPLGTHQCYQPGQIIFYEGHMPLGIYLHQTGHITLLRGRRPVRQCAVPCVLGLQLLFMNAPYPYSARTEDTVSLIFVPRTALTQFRATREDLYHAIEKAALGA